MLLPLAADVWQSFDDGLPRIWEAISNRQAVAALGFAASDKGEMIKPGNYAEIEQQINAELIQWLGQAEAK